MKTCTCDTRPVDAIPEIMALWVRNADWEGGAWTDAAMHSTNPVDLNTVVAQSRLPWLVGGDHDAPSAGWYVLGGLPVQHIVVVPAGVTPEPNWIGSDCHIDGVVDRRGGCIAFVFENMDQRGRERWWWQSDTTTPVSRLHIPQR